MMVYHFDGTLPGLLCAVYDSYTRKEGVTALLPPDRTAFSLFPTRRVETEEANARRVFASLDTKLGVEGRELVTTAFLHNDPDGDKDLAIFRFICMGYQKGPMVCKMLGDAVVSRVAKMARSVINERHRMLEFLRFSQCSLPEMGALPALADSSTPLQVAGSLAFGPVGSGLAAIIEPKHFVLPMMSEHFCGRYPEERFMIYDKTHRLALVYRPHAAQMIEMGDFSLPEKSPEEELAQRLWQGYYDTIAIEARLNPLCRRTNLPKRFWPNMVELSGR